MQHMEHILVVDDDREIRELVGSYLTKNGMRVSLAADGELAGTVENIVYIGTDTLYLLKVAGQSGFRVRQQNHDGALQRCAVGDAVRIKVPASAIRVLPQ